MIIFDARNIISYHEFNSFISNKQKKFSTEKNNLFEHYGILKPVPFDGNIDRYQKFRSEYRSLVQNILKEVISYYREYLPEELLIVQFGSFIKNTERIFSDLDFTISYDVPKTKEYECAEELINYSLAKVLGLAVDQVHGIFQDCFKISSFDTYTRNDNHFQLIFNEYEVDYKCRKGTFIERLTSILNVRDYNSMMTGYYEEKYKKRCYIDCLYSIEILENTTSHDFYAHLAFLEKEYGIFDEESSQVKELSCDSFTVADIKYALRDEGLGKLYGFAVKLRSIVQICDSYSMNIDMLWNNERLIKLLGINYWHKLRIAYVTFIFYLNRLDVTLHSNGVDFSSHCHTTINAEHINHLLAKDWDSGTNIKTILTARDEMLQQINSGLSELFHEIESE